MVSFKNKKWIQILNVLVVLMLTALACNMPAADSHPAAPA